MEFGWWNKDADGRKYQVCAKVFGRTITWRRKQGHHQPWEPHPPTDDDWKKLTAEAKRRVPRRLLSPRQFAQIKNSRRG